MIYAFCSLFEEMVKLLKATTTINHKIFSYLSLLIPKFPFEHEFEARTT